LQAAAATAALMALIALALRLWRSAGRQEAKETVGIVSEKSKVSSWTRIHPAMAGTRVSREGRPRVAVRTAFAIPESALDSWTRRIST